MSGQKRSGRNHGGDNPTPQTNDSAVVFEDVCRSLESLGYIVAFRADASGVQISVTRPAKKVSIVLRVGSSTKKVSVDRLAGAIVSDVVELIEAPESGITQLSFAI